jgi:hypothetical protein
MSEVGVDRGIQRTIVVFARLAGGWLFRVWIATVVGTVVPIVLALAGIVDVTREFWWFLLGIGFLVLPLVGFHMIRVERDELEANLDPQRLFPRLGELIKDGTRIRNGGRIFLSDESVDRWVGEATAWTGKALAVLQEVAPGVAPNFETLEKVTAQLPAGYSPHNSKHLLHLRMLTQRIEYLKAQAAAYERR